MIAVGGADGSVRFGGGGGFEAAVEFGEDGVDPARAKRGFLSAQIVGLIGPRCGREVAADRGAIAESDR